MNPKTIVDTQRFAAMVAEKQKWKLNTDKEFTDSLIDGLTVNWNRYGYFLCPCRDTEGSRELDAAVICPCRFAAADIEEHGHCYCALYLKPEFVDQGKSPMGIPDRRFT